MFTLTLNTCVLFIAMDFWRTYLACSNQGKSFENVVHAHVTRMWQLGFNYFVSAFVMSVPICVTLLWFMTSGLASVGLTDQLTIEACDEVSGEIWVNLAKLNIWKICRTLYTYPRLKQQNIHPTICLTKMLNASRTLKWRQFEMYTSVLCLLLSFVF